MKQGPWVFARADQTAFLPAQAIDTADGGPGPDRASGGEALRLANHASAFSILLLLLQASWLISLLFLLKRCPRALATDPELIDLPWRWAISHWHGRLQEW